jgi:tetratricopeptide (TPR) repeat protein
MADTEAARTDMRFASKYLEQKQFSEAREYVTSARRKDPNVTLAVKTESKTVAELTPNSLEADILVEQTRAYAKEIDKITEEKEKHHIEQVKRIDRNAEKLDRLTDSKDILEEMNKQAIERSYHDPKATQRYKDFHSQIDDLREKIATNLQEAIQLNPAPNLYGLLGAVYVDQKKYADAVEILTPVQEAQPEHFEVRRALDAAIKGHQLQQQLATAPVTYHLPPKPINIFAWALSIGLASLAIAILTAYNASLPRPFNEIIWVPPIIALTIAYFKRHS